MSSWQLSAAQAQQGSTPSATLRASSSRATTFSSPTSTASSSGSMQALKESTFSNFKISSLDNHVFMIETFFRSHLIGPFPASFCLFCLSDNTRNRKLKSPMSGFETHTRRIKVGCPTNCATVDTVDSTTLR